MKKHPLIIAITLILTPFAYADKPDFLGKGKPNQEEVRDSKNKQKMMSSLEEREQHLELLLEEKKQAKKNAKNNKDKKKLEKEIEKLEDTQKKLKNKNLGKEKNKSNGNSQIVSNENNDKPSFKGLEKQSQKKVAQERTEQGKGYDKGQKQREANSKKWWKFWE